MLELENKQLKEQKAQDLKLKNQQSAVTSDERNWMSSFGAGSGGPGGVSNRPAMPERPMTAST